jgi:hypothetical protein
MRQPVLRGALLEGGPVIYRFLAAVARYGEFRQCLIRRFPYSIYSRISEDAIVIITSITSVAIQLAGRGAV